MEDNNGPQVGWLGTSLSRRGVIKFHLEHRATFLSSQLISDSVANDLPTATTHSDSSASRRNLGETMLLPALILLMVLAPVIVPALITAFHVFSLPD